MTWIKQLPQTIQQRFFAAMADTEFSVGETLYAQGELAHAAYFLYQGRVQLGTTSASGKEILFSVHGAGELVGETALIENGNRMYSAVATEAGRMGVISANDFNQLRHEFAVFNDAVTSALLHMLHNLVLQINQTALWSLDKRVAFALLRHHQPDDGKITLSQEDLGHLLGVTRQSVHRAVKLLHELNLVHTQNRRLFVLDSGALRLYYKTLS